MGTEEEEEGREEKEKKEKKKGRRREAACIVLTCQCSAHSCVSVSYNVVYWEACSSVFQRCHFCSCG
eukprot:10000593-Karenia_brevis.AAC.1